PEARFVGQAAADRVANAVGRHSASRKEPNPPLRTQGHGRDGAVGQACWRRQRRPRLAGERSSPVADAYAVDLDLELLDALEEEQDRGVALKKLLHLRYRKADSLGRLQWKSDNGCEATPRKFQDLLRLLGDRHRGEVTGHRCRHGGSFVRVAESNRPP